MIKLQTTKFQSNNILRHVEEIKLINIDCYNYYIYQYGLERKHEGFRYDH